MNRNRHSLRVNGDRIILGGQAVTVLRGNLTDEASSTPVALMLRTMAGHDLSHIDQIQRYLAAARQKNALEP